MGRPNGPFPQSAIQFPGDFGAPRPTSSMGLPHRPDVSSTDAGHRSRRTRSISICSRNYANPLHPRSTRCCNQSKPTEPPQQMLLERPQATRSEQHPLFATRAFAYLEHRMLRNSSERRRLEGRADAALEPPCSSTSRAPRHSGSVPGASRGRPPSLGSRPRLYRAARWAARPPTHALVGRVAGTPLNARVRSSRRKTAGLALGGRRSPLSLGATRRALPDEHGGDAAKAPTCEKGAWLSRLSPQSPTRRMRSMRISVRPRPGMR